MGTRGDISLPIVLTILKILTTGSAKENTVSGRQVSLQGKGSSQGTSWKPDYNYEKEGGSMFKMDLPFLAFHSLRTPCCYRGWIIQDSGHEKSTAGNCAISTAL